MSEETRTLLTWLAGQYGTFTGQAGETRLFRVSWKSRREDPNYLMRTDLPGVYREWANDDLGVLKATAEQVLAAWLAKVAQSPGLHDRDLAFEAWNEREDYGHDLVEHVHHAYDAGWDARGGAGS